jgi:hypothetical protein
LHGGWFLACSVGLGGAGNNSANAEFLMVEDYRRDYPGRSGTSTFIVQVCGNYTATTGAVTETIRAMRLGFAARVRQNSHDASPPLRRRELAGCRALIGYLANVTD